MAILVQALLLSCKHRDQRTIDPIMRTLLLLFSAPYQPIATVKLPIMSPLCDQSPSHSSSMLWILACAQEKVLLGAVARVV